MRNILVFGSVNRDFTYELPHIARFGETIASTAFRTAWGGKGLNQALALAKAGASVRLAARISSADLPALREYCRPFGLDISCVQGIDTPTGHAIIQVDPEGQNSIIVCAGANGTWESSDIEGVLALAEPGSLLILQNEVSRIPEILRAARERGLVTALNPSPFTDRILTWPLECADIFLLNRTEGAALSGETEPDAMLAALIARYPGAKIMLTLGSEGALYTEEGEIFRQPIFPADAVDCTAAGDVFSGYFLSMRSQGHSIAESLRTAAAAAAVCVSRPGAADAIPSPEEVAAFAAQF